MDIDIYKAITGTDIPLEDESRYIAIINKTKLILESLLGYTIDPSFYQGEREFMVSQPTVNIDPASVIKSVALSDINGNKKVLTAYEYTKIKEQGEDFYKYIKLLFNKNIFINGDILSIIVDADWGFSTLPDELLQLWADMITYEADYKKNIKSETLGGHSYTKDVIDTKPQESAHYMMILCKYAGGNGTINIKRVL